MPIYQYECENCGCDFELLRAISEGDSDITCPECKAEHPKRVISAFSSFSSGGDCAPIGGG